MDDQVLGVDRNPEKELIRDDKSNPNPTSAFLDVHGLSRCQVAEIISAYINIHALIAYPQFLGQDTVLRVAYRAGYFTDSCIIATKAFVSRMYQNFKSHFISRHEKVPKRIQGLEGIYSLKRLSESIS